MQSGGATFTKGLRLLKPGEFRLVRSKGGRAHTKHFIIYTFSNGLEGRRLGLAISARVGGAVERNRIKRLLREFFRLNYDRLLPSKDILITAKKGIGREGLSEITDELAKILFTGKKAL